MGRPSNFSRAVADVRKFFFVAMPQKYTNAHINAKEQCERFLERRGGSLDEWKKAAIQFFYESLHHHNYLILQGYLLKSLDYRFPVEDDRVKFFSLVAEAIGKSDDSARRWVVGPTLPDIKHLQAMRLSKGIKLDDDVRSKLYNDALNVRFSIARTLSYMNAYPWVRLPDEESRYARNARDRTIEVLEAVKCYDPRPSACTLYNHQRVFDVVCGENPRAIIAEGQIGVLKALVEGECRGRRRRPAPPDPFPFEEWFIHYAILDYLLRFYGSDDIVNFAWAWNHADADYKAVWGYT